MLKHRILLRNIPTTSFCQKCRKLLPAGTMAYMTVRTYAPLTLCLACAVSMQDKFDLEDYN